MKVINFVFCGIFVAMYIAGWLFPKFRRYIKKNIWLDNLPGVLELIFFINLSEYLFVSNGIGNMARFFPGLLLFLSFW